MKEGNLEAPTRHAIAWKNPEFYDEAALDKELERVFDICHGCRRCVSLCNAFPTLFDLIDAAGDAETAGVAKSDYTKFVDQRYLCDVYYMIKCPYVPLTPDGSNFKATMQIEYADETERRRMLGLLKGIEDSVWIQVAGGDKVFAIADEDLVRENEEKTSAVHFLRFELDAAMVAQAKNGAAISVGVDHAEYRATIAALSDEVRISLVADLH